MRKWQTVIIRGGIRLKLCQINKTQARLGIHAPENMHIDREEDVGKGNKN
ncbi:MAG: carbon storage regulator [Anaerolineae bacterium]